MGTVFLARDLKHGRNVAIKVLPPEIAQAIGTERFLREIAISARLTHPHVLSIHDSGQAAGLLYYVMPFIAGESLRERLDHVGSLELREACRIAGDLADALAYAHGEGVIHRDVKPENVLLAGGHALLADFGVARALGTDDDVTDSGLAVGTRRYTSPEQAAGSPAVGAGADIYSLGCVLHEMLAGRAAPEALERRLVEPLPAIARTRPDVPDWVDAVIARATARQPSERFQTAQALGTALLHPPSDANRHARGTGGRRRPAWWIVTTTAALGAAIAAFAVRTSGTADLARDRIVIAAFENRTGDSTLAPLGAIASDYIARGLAATHLIRDVFDARALALETGHRPQVDAAAGRRLAT